MAEPASSPTLEPRTGMPSVKLLRGEFTRRFLAQYADPAFGLLAGRAETFDGSEITAGGHRSG